MGDDILLESVLFLPENWENFSLKLLEYPGILFSENGGNPVYHKSDNIRVVMVLLEIMMTM